MTIATDALPRPSAVELEPQDVRAQSSGWRPGGILRTRDVDPANQPRLWTLVYDRKHGAVSDAIRQHFAQHNSTDFDWTPPGASNAVRVIHREPPSIDWDNAVTATARVYLEEVLAHD